MGKTITDVVRDLGRAGRLQAALTLSDAQLLEQFALQRDEAAFEALLHRHGPLVFGVCRRLLFDAHDAEDAFQATFLILARKAGGIGRRSLVGNWLYGVAYKVAARARKTTLRRRVREQTVADLASVPGAGWSQDPDVAPLIHEELQRLPDKYRRPVVLCYLEGKTNEEAATHLHWPVGTVKTRLGKARELLRSRLARRGVALSAGLLAANMASAAAPAGLLNSTSKAGMSYAAGDGAAHGLASAQAVALTKGVLQTMMLTKLKLVAAAVLGVALIAGMGGLAYYGRAVEPSAKDDKRADKPKGDKDLIQGTWKVKRVVMEGKDVSDKGGEAKFFMESTWTITDGKIVINSGAEVGEITFKLDPAAKPKAIDWTIVSAPNKEVIDKSFSGVYSLEGDALKIHLGADRPTELKTKEGDMSMLLLLTRDTGMAANRMASQTNLKQIALAMHNYEILHGHLPPAAIRDNNGRPLLSWRVAILPFIAQVNLYNQFKLDEPWDSEINKKLLKEMPSVYAPVNVRTKEPYTTFCQVFTGKGTAFESDEGQKMADIVDGTSNTLMVVEASERVPWTKPEDLVYDPHKPLPKLGGQFSDGFNAAFCDATVRLIQKSTKEGVLRALITRNGGEVISAEEKP